MDDFRFRPQQSPRNDMPMNNPLVSPSRNANPNGSRLPQPQAQQQQQPQSQAPHDPRVNLSRRFTTDSGRVPTLSNMSPMTSPQRGPEAPQDYVRPPPCSCLLAATRETPADSPIAVVPQGPIGTLHPDASTARDLDFQRYLPIPICLPHHQALCRGGIGCTP